MKKFWAFLPVVAFAALAAVFWGALGRDPSVLPSALIDKPAPAFDLAPVEGIDRPGLKTADLPGEVTLVNVFASWCVPCKAEHPLLTDLADEGIRVVGVNYKDKPEDVVAWLARDGNPYERIGADPDGRAGIEWGIAGVPETFVLDAQGRVRHRVWGPLDPNRVETELRPVLEALK